MPKLDEQLKLAIARMPQKEKDKLLLRLVAKDEKLVERLVFELLEGGETTDERAREIRDLIEKSLPQPGARHLTPGWLLMDLRSLNARITDHVKTTKDKPGEVILGCFLFAEAIRRHREMLHKLAKRSDTFSPYFVKRAEALVKKGEKLHEDLHLEFRHDLNEVLHFIWDFPPTRSTAADVFLPKKFEF